MTTTRPARREVRFFLPGYPGQRVELAGDFPDFRVLHPTVERDGGHAAALALGPGVYRYKFLVDRQHWVLEPSPGLTETLDGITNGVVVVEGSAGPLVWAADRRHLRRREGGGAAGIGRGRGSGTGHGTSEEVFVRADLVDGHPVPSWACADAGAVTMRGPVEVVGKRGDRLFLRGALTTTHPSPAPADSGQPPTRQCRVWLEGYEDAALPWPPPATERVPAWAEGVTLYSILVDRWHRGSTSPPDPRAFPRHRPSTPSVFYGGDLAGIAEHLDYLADLGVGGLVLTPVHPSPTPHRYDSLDLLSIDPRLGGESGFAALIEATHRRGLRVIADLAVTHVNHRHPAFLDLLEHQERSRYRRWFRVKSFPVRRRDGRTYEHYYQCHDLPWLNLEEPEVRAHVEEAALRYLARGVDGLRLDALLEAPDGFWRGLRSTVKARYPEALLLGELVGDHQAPFLDENGADVLTDARDREALIAFFGRRDIDAAELWARLSFHDHRAGGPSSTRAAYLDSIDTARMGSVLPGADDVALALAVLLFSPTLAILTYGMELDVAARAGDFALDGAWPERLAIPPCPPVGPPVGAGTDDGPPQGTRSALRALLRARKAMVDDGAGRVTALRAEGEVLVLERRGRTARWQLALARRGDPPSSQPASASGSVGQPMAVVAGGKCCLLRLTDLNRGPNGSRPR